MSFWRFEADTLRRACADERPALHEALFSLRADLADVLYVPLRADFEDQVTRALVQAEVRAAKKQLVVDAMATQQAQPALNDFATELATKRATLLPRRTEDGDVGMPSWNENELARVAHMLHHGFGLSMPAAACVLTDAGYFRPGRGFDDHLNRQFIHRLLHVWSLDPDGPRTVQGDDIRRWGRSASLFELPPAMVVYGLDPATDHTQRAQQLAQEHGFVCGGSATAERGDRGLPQLLRLICDFHAVRALYVLDADLFADDVERQIVYALAERFGVKVLEDARPVRAGFNDPSEDGVLRQGTRLFTALRWYDKATVLESHRTRDHARARALQLQDQLFNYREIAHRLNAEAVPSSTRDGGWGKGRIETLLNGDAS
ncbi:hypothetical protein NLX86_09860 [Streptomyces sp. A3M-1-3]|uniref:hypothetical protein n=1 Tax=Streptomyces sp. A3M-1-3 TaxID=2962044 RepID=UPI0020B76D6A|nr:hypothetical protein [Streptomyces sp. A3M-1-3]MCP3818409.1 hypothetical protein [Streptomyces sp. A3M-1-3]